MKIIDIKNKKYLVKREFTKKFIKDVTALNDIKWIYGADTILKSKDGETVILAQKIEDAEIIHETEKDENYIQRT